MEMQSLWKKVEIPLNFIPQQAMRFDNLFVTVGYFSIWK